MLFNRVAISTFILTVCITASAIADPAPPVGGPGQQMQLPCTVTSNALTFTVTCNPGGVQCTYSLDPNDPTTPEPPIPGSLRAQLESKIGQFFDQEEATRLCIKVAAASN